MTSLANLRSRLSEDYVRDPNHKVWTSETKDRALNKAYYRVQADLWYNLGENENNSTRETVIGSELYELPSTFTKLNLVRYEWDDLIKTERKYVKKMDETPQSGTPRRYYLYNDLLGIYPVPDAVGTLDLEYSELEATMTSSQGSVLATITDDAVTLYAAYKLFLWARDGNSASLFRQDYENEINRLKTSLLFDDSNMRFKYQREWYTSRDRTLNDYTRR